MVTYDHFRSCLSLKHDLVSVGLLHDWCMGTNESLITRARNEMTASFLGTEHTHMFWLDADMSFEPEDIAKIWNLQADIGVGVYALKRPDKPGFAAWHGGRLVTNLEQFGGPIEVDYAGTGFMCIKREVIETLASDAPTYEGPDGGRVHELYKTHIWNDIYESEDYYFCRKAREAGFKVIMDPSVRLGHIGQYRYGSP